MSENATLAMQNDYHFDNQHGGISGRFGMFFGVRRHTTPTKKP